MTDDLNVLKAKLNQETAKASWQELQPFFARGQLVAVASELDLIEVAVAFSQDQSTQLAQWREAGLVDKVTDQQAAQWHDAAESLWTVVVMPWVLVQPAS